MTKVSTTVVFNAAFLYEIKEDHQELWRLLGECRDSLQRLRSTAPAEQSDAWHATSEKLSNLRDQLAMHFALEEFYGYLDEPVSTAPQLADAADRLRSQHAPLFVEACRMADTADAADHRARHAESARELLEAFRNFDAGFRAHEAEETRLIVQALEDDIGAGD